jgi:hypothetical protein
MEIDILDPFVFAPGDYTIFDAVIFELSVRKLLEDAGYQQKDFKGHIDMLPTLEGKRAYYHESNFGEVLKFVVGALKFLGFRILRKGDLDVCNRLAVKLPQVISAVSIYGHFDDDTYYEVETNNNTVFIRIDEDTRYNWMGLVGVVEYLIKVKEMIGRAEYERYCGKWNGNDPFKAGTISITSLRRQRRWSYRERRAA